MDKLAQAIINNDYKMYQQIRYTELQIADGENIIFENVDFSNVDFDKFILGFFIFKNCNLDNAKNFHGKPICMKNCSAVGIDFSDSDLVINALKTNFSNMKYNNSIFADKSNGEAGISQFEDCVFDDDAKEYLKNQGAIIK